MSIVIVSSEVVPEKASFDIAGQRGELSREEVRRRLRDETPGTVREHAVEIDGTTFPVKQAFAAATGLDLLDFNTIQARTFFRKLGFPVMRSSGSGMSQAAALRRGPRKR